MFGGLVYKGKIRVHQQLLLGPDNKGKFRKIEVKSLKCLKVSVLNVIAGQICTVAVNFGKDSEKFLKKVSGQFRKGLVIIHPSLHPIACRKFEAEIASFDTKPRVISSNYQPLVYTDHIRQTAQIIMEPKKIDEHDIIQFTVIPSHNPIMPIIETEKAIFPIKPQIIMEPNKIDEHESIQLTVIPSQTLQ